MEVPVSSSSAIPIDNSSPSQVLEGSQSGGVMTTELDVVSSNAGVSSSEVDVVWVIPDVVLVRILEYAALADLVKRCPLVSRRWHQTVHTVFARSSFSICSKIYKQPTGEFVFSMIVAYVGQFCEPNSSVYVTRPPELMRCVFSDSVRDLAIFCPEAIEDWDNFNWVAEDHYHFLRRFHNIISLEFINANPKTFCMPFGRLTVRALFPGIRRVRCSYAARDFKVLVDAQTSRHFVPEVSVDFTEKRVLWTASTAFNVIEEFIEVLQADGLVNFGSCSTTIGSRLFGIFLALNSIDLTAQSCRATNLFRLITKLRIIVTAEQKLQETLTYVSNLKDLELDDQGQCNCVLRLPNLPSVTKAVFRIHSSILERSTLSGLPNVKDLEIYSDNCGELWLEHLDLSVEDMPKLSRLKLDCFEDGYAMPPKYVDNILPDLVGRRPRLRVLELGAGVSPTVLGIMAIAGDCCTLARLSANLASPDFPVLPLVEAVGASSLEQLHLGTVRTLEDIVAETLETFPLPVATAGPTGDSCRQDDLPMKKRRLDPSSVSEKFPETCTAAQFGPYNVRIKYYSNPAAAVNGQSLDDVAEKDRPLMERELWISWQSSNGNAGGYLEAPPAGGYISAQHWIRFTEFSI